MKNSDLLALAQVNLLSTYNIKDQEFKISKGSVIRVVGGKSAVLFNNVERVKEVRLGPDGKTLHFRPDGIKDPAQFSYCANLEKKDDPPPPDLPQADYPPQQPPWDFKSIGYAYTISSCPNKSNGFLENSAYFCLLR